VFSDRFNGQSPGQQPTLSGTLFEKSGMLDTRAMGEPHKPDVRFAPTCSASNTGSSVLEDPDRDCCISFASFESDHRRANDSVSPADKKAQIERQFRSHAQFAEPKGGTVDFSMNVAMSFLPGSVKLAVQEYMPEMAAETRMVKMNKRRCTRLDWLLRLVNHTTFATTIAVLIVVNALLIGLATEYELRVAFNEFNGHGGTVKSVDTFFFTADMFFTVVFTVELLMRLVALEMTFFLSPEGRWNFVDFVLVIISIAEAALAGLNVEVSYVRLLRLCRIFRTMRVVRTVPQFIKLRTMICAIVNSVGSLMWALVLLVCVMLMFAAIFLQGAAAYIRKAEPFDTRVEFLKEFFSSMPMALLTLFMSITGGVSWWEVQEELMAIHLIYGVFFVVYMAIMILALMNIVTGIFLADALDIAAMDKDVLCQGELEKKQKYMESLKSVFESLDKDGTNTLTKEEFTGYMEHPEIVALFSVLGLDVSDVIGFFEALDVDGSEELEIDEFVMGCMHLRGEAKTVDMVTLMRENKRMMKKIGDGLRRSEELILDLTTSLRQEEEGAFSDSEEIRVQELPSNLIASLIEAAPDYSAMMGSVDLDERVEYASPYGCKFAALCP